MKAWGNSFSTTIKVRADASTGTENTIRMMDPRSLCPDLLGLDYVGDADHLRGRVVRGFFWLMRLWPKPKPRAR